MPLKPARKLWHGREGLNKVRFRPESRGFLARVKGGFAYLRDRSITTLQFWLDGVVPLGQSFVVLQSKGSNLIPCGLETARIETAVEVGGDLKSGLGLCGTGVVEDLLVGI